ncbi:50S ribosomal protein L23 [Cocos nucifera]|nr:50S ribosomal protein L23 [Cocos nucifera]
MPSRPFDSIREIALKTIPPATKVEIRRVLESLYGFDVAKVRTLNMEGKKVKRGAFLAAKPDYKKAYVTPDLFPIPLIQEERERIAAAQAKSRPTVVEGEDGAGGQRHWLDERREDEGPDGRRRYGGGGGGRTGGGGKRGAGKKAEGESKFRWSSMPLSSR